MTDNNQTKSPGRGGKRVGAGRKKGSATKRTREIADRAAKEGITPLEFMLDVMRNEPPAGLEPSDELKATTLRFEAAKAAAPYMHPRLAAVEVTGEGGGPIETRTTLDVAGLSTEQLRALSSIPVHGG